MKIGWIGLGKLGLPCALTLQHYGNHDVFGYDVSSKPKKILEGKDEPPREEGIDQLLKDYDHDRFKIMDSVESVVANSEIVFIAVQTPHALNYGGKIPAPSDRKDFEYHFLVQACRDVVSAARKSRKYVSMVVVSTVLPGTLNRLIRPFADQWVRLIYSPAFIAMGTTISDYRNPEFVICGVDNPANSILLRQVFEPVHDGNRLFVTDIETAELIKVAYNTYISTKIVWANTLMEICHKTGADCDKVVDALSLADNRIISPKYMRGGMGDGGACHPRDLIAMSWLSERLDLSYDLLGGMVRARESQTRWLADLAWHYSDVAHLPIVILGKSYKPESDLTYGSPAMLLAHYLGDLVSQHFDPYIDRSPIEKPDGVHIKPSVVVIATKHPDFAEYNYQAGSVVIDPFGYIPDKTDVTVIRVGRKS